MKKSLCLLAITFITFSGSTALADTIQTFYVNAQGLPVDLVGCCKTIGGTITIDTSNGTVIAAYIPAPASFFLSGQLEILTDVFYSAGTAQGWELKVGYEFLFGGRPVLDPVLHLFFSTTHPGSLVGFSGGTITDGRYWAPFEGLVLLDNLQGTISPEPIPEPSSMLLLGTGLVAGAVRRKLAR